MIAAGAALLLPPGRPGPRPARRGRGGLSFDPRLAALSLAAFTLLYTMGALVVIYPNYITGILGLGMGSIAVAMALAGLTYTFLQPLTGRLADILDKRLLVAIGVPLATVAAALAGGTSGPGLVYSSMLLFGVSGALAFPAANALVGLIAPRGRKGTYTGAIMPC